MTDPWHKVPVDVDETLFNLIGNLSRELERMGAVGSSKAPRFAAELGAMLLGVRAAAALERCAHQLERCAEQLTIRNADKLSATEGTLLAAAAAGLANAPVYRCNRCGATATFGAGTECFAPGCTGRMEPA